MKRKRTQLARPRRKPRLDAMTPAEVDAITAPGLHMVAPHLALSIGRNGCRSWFYRYTFNGKSRSHWLGPCSRVPLDEALAEVERLRDQADPQGQKERRRARAQGLVLVSTSERRDWF